MSLKPYTWPQDTLQIPGGGRFMPPVERGNIDVARQESFVMSGSFTYGPGAIAAGQQLQLMIPTDQDGDFWCDQIAAIEWRNNIAQNQDTRPSTIDISDVRTGRKLTYPTPMPVKFLTTLNIFQGDVGITLGDSPPPEGFRATSTIPQPFCFTRQGGIQLVLTFIFPIPAGITRTLDIAFTGWKEYTYASMGQG